MHVIGKNAHEPVIPFFERLGVKVLGSQPDVLRMCEDRDLFVQALDQINIPVAKSEAVSSVPAALKAAKEIGYPVIVRAAYALGGLGSGFAEDEDELRDLSARSLSLSPQILVEKSLKGWKESEYEVLRDQEDVSARACVVSGFHTGRAKMAGFFDVIGQVGLMIDRIWEEDINGQQRAWDREREDDQSERKRWLAIAVLKRM